MTAILGRPSVRSFATNGFSFPKHKELLTEDFYDDTAHDNENPYGKPSMEGDTESYRHPTHRPTATGVLSSYKKQLNLTAKDYIMKDYWDQMASINQDVTDNFMKADRSKATKQLVDRIRLGRNVTSPIEGAGDEYGNYKKFEKSRNKVEEVNDKGYDDRGHDTFIGNVDKMFEAMKNRDHDAHQEARDLNYKDVVDRSIKSEVVEDNKIMDQFLGAKNDIDNQQIYK